MVQGLGLLHLCGRPGWSSWPLVANQLISGHCGCIGKPLDRRTLYKICLSNQQTNKPVFKKKFFPPKRTDRVPIHCTATTEVRQEPRSGARYPIYGYYMSNRKLTTWTISYCLPGYTPAERKLDMGAGIDMECGYPNWHLNCQTKYLSQEHYSIYPMVTKYISSDPLNLLIVFNLWLV